MAARTRYGLLAVLVNFYFYFFAIFAFEKVNLRHTYPSIVIQDLNALMTEFSGCFIHMILPGNDNRNASDQKPFDIHIEEPLHPVSISVATGKYALPSRHLRAEQVCRAIIVVLPAYSELTIAQYVSTGIYPIDPSKLPLNSAVPPEYTRLDCIPSEKPDLAACFKFPVLYIFLALEGEGKEAMAQGVPLPSYRDNLFTVLDFVSFDLESVQMGVTEEAGKQRTELELGFVLKGGTTGKFGLVHIPLQNCSSLGSKDTSPGICQSELESLRSALDSPLLSNTVYFYGVYNKEMGFCTLKDAYARQNSTTAYIQNILDPGKRKQMPLFDMPNGTDPFYPPRIHPDVVLWYLALSTLSFYAAAIGSKECIPDRYEGDDTALALVNLFPWMKVQQVSEYDDVDQHLVLVRTVNMQAATCDGVRKELDFEFLLDPFDHESWTLVGTAMVLLSGLVLALVMFLGLARGSFWHTTFILLVSNSFGVLVEQPPFIPRALKQNATLKSCFAFTLTLSALMAVILTNAYKGLVVSELASPIPVHSRWESFSELEDFRLYTMHLSMAFQDWMWEGHDAVLVGSEGWLDGACTNTNRSATRARTQNSESKSDNCDQLQALLDTGLSMDDVKRWQFWVTLRARRKQVHKSDEANMAATTTRRLVPGKLTIAVAHSYHDVMNTLTPNQTRDFVAAISNCHKTGIIETEEQLRHFIRFIKAKTRGKSIPVQVGDTLTIRRVYYAIEYAPSGRAGLKVYKRVQNMLAMGIYELWDTWYREKHETIWEEEAERVHAADYDDDAVVEYNENKPMPLSLNSNMQAPFYILGYGFGAAVASFTLEIGLPLLRKWVAKFISYVIVLYCFDDSE